MSADISIQIPPLQEVNTEWSSRRDVSLKLLRLDQVHPQLGGNKWFKLRLNLAAAKNQGFQTIVSFGGAYSNHLRALAAAGNRFGFKTIGVIRGELVHPLNPVLAFAKSQGMELLPLDRASYRAKHTPDFLNELLKELKPDYGDVYVIPEGGSNNLGVEGCTEIAQYLRFDSNAKSRIVSLACGTGTTLAGLLLGMKNCALSQAQVFGISVLKAPGYIADEVSAVIERAETTSKDTSHLPSWQVRDDFHCGGYAKSNADLQLFLAEWQANCTVPIEPIYTGKLLLGLQRLCESGEIVSGSEIIAIHTGGVH